MAETNFDKVDKLVKDMDDILKTVDMKDVALDQITVRMGGRMLKFTKISDDEIPLEQEIRREYNTKLSAKLSDISTHIHNKINEAMRTIAAQKEEFERKERLLQDKLAKAAPMPDVFSDHARKGLSIFKGDRAGEIKWLVRRTYWPKFVDRKPIDPDFIKKFITPIYVLIVTSGNKVTGVSTRKLAGLDAFEHYHQAHPDCWGQWKWPTEWKTPDDIIQIADQAEAVLENVNRGSIARQDPMGLPKIDTLMRHLVPDKFDPTVALGRDDLARTGIRTPRGTGAAEDVWQS